MTNLPPLNSLRAFDAAARRLTFTSAAEHLHVTHGAVSRQVQQLETFLGQRLFDRLPKGLELTAAGRQLAFTTGRMFEDLGQIVSELRADSRLNIITVSTVASLAARWLVPRLSNFHSRHPDYEVHIGTSTRLVDFRREGVDLAIRFGRGNWNNVFCERLFCPREFPVCAPALLEGKHSLRTPQDLENFTLLHDMTHAHWGQWLELAGADNVDSHAGLLLEDMNVLLQAAIEGQGVALASRPLVTADLNAARLVRPFELELPVELAFYAVCELGRENESGVKELIAWLREEAKPMQEACRKGV